MMLVIIVFILKSSGFSEIDQAFYPIVDYLKPFEFSGRSCLMCFIVDL